MGERKRKPLRPSPQVEVIGCTECPVILTSRRCPKCAVAVCVQCSSKHPCTRPPSRPTSGPMLGGETGEASIDSRAVMVARDVARWVGGHNFHTRDLCLDPTTRAKP